MNRRAFFRNSALLTAGVVAADQLELVERLGWKRRFFQGWTPENIHVQFNSHERIRYVRYVVDFKGGRMGKDGWYEGAQTHDGPFVRLTVNQPPLQLVEVA